MNTQQSYRASVRPVESYGPPDVAQHEWLRELLAEHPFASEARFGCYLVSDSSAYSDLARAVECAVFQHYFGNAPSIMTAEYADYEAHSKFLLVVDREMRRPAGTLRIIEHSDAGFKSLNDIKAAPLSIPVEKALAFHEIDNLERCWDIGTLAVLSQYRGKSTNHLISTMLYGLLHMQCRRFGIEHLVAILDMHAFKQLTELLAVPFVTIADSEPFEYLGSPNSVASYLHLPRVVPTAEAFLSRLNDDMRALIEPFLTRVVYGEGLPEVIEVE
jgi:hypothetical protein